MQGLKPFFIFMGTVAIILLAFATQANDVMDKAAPICMPEQEHVDAVNEAYVVGIELGQRQGYVQGGYAAAEEILDFFEAQCTHSGAEIELSNDITVVCK